MRICNWLPKLVLYNDYAGWENYQDVIYQIFRHDFIDTFPEFEGKRVKIRFYPIEFGKEEAFYHVTCQDYEKDGERVPDFRRCERIKWVRKFIENYQCNLEECVDCSGIKMWEEPYGNNKRVHILFEEERYMVVVERRDRYCLLITAFYFEKDHSLQKKLKKYNLYKAESALQSKTQSGTPSTLVDELL